MQMEKLLKGNEELKNVKKRRRRVAHTNLVTKVESNCVTRLLRLGRTSTSPGGSRDNFCLSLSASLICCLLSQIISARFSHLKLNLNQLD